MFNMYIKFHEIEGGSRVPFYTFITVPCEQTTQIYNRHGSILFNMFRYYFIYSFLYMFHVYKLTMLSYRN